MRRMLNTLFVTRPQSYLALKNETVTVLEGDECLLRVPLCNLEGIVYFGYKGASPQLMGECAKRGISLSFMSERGRFLASTAGESDGNVLLRREQYRIADDEQRSLDIAKSIICAKLYNSVHFIARTIRDHALRVDADELRRTIERIRLLLKNARECGSMAELRGYEGGAAEAYYGVFSEHILQNEREFAFNGRSRRPPLDRTNALLSFAYVLAAADCRAALRSVGLDPYVGFMHTDRSGRASLALDIVEELRSPLSDRFVITLINERIIRPEMFTVSETGAVSLDESGRRAFLTAWQRRKQDVITHPFLKEKIEWGMVPYAQALLLARYIRGDLDAYPSFMWRQ